MAVGGFLRVVRAAVFAAVCVVLAAVGHVLMSGTGLPWWALVGSAALIGTVDWSFGARQRRRRTVTGATVTVQATLHAGFTLAQLAQAAATAPPGAVAGDGPGAGAGAVPVMDHMAGTSSWGMLAVHTLAAALCGLWLAQGERAAFTLLKAGADLLFVPLRLALTMLRPLTGPPRLRMSDRSRSRPRRLLLAHSLTTRGPPVGTAVV